MEQGLAKLKKFIKELQNKKQFRYFDVLPLKNEITFLLTAVQQEIEKTDISAIEPTRPEGFPEV